MEMGARTNVAGLRSLAWLGPLTFEWLSQAKIRCSEVGFVIMILVIMTIKIIRINDLTDAWEDHRMMVTNEDDGLWRDQE